jgi:hypothetical protein
MHKLIISVLLTIGISHCIIAQVEVIHGTLTKKPWSKTIDSYCAGGSEYYVLVENDNNEIVLDVSVWKQAKIDRLTNQKISLRGKWKSYEKEKQDRMAQQPVSAPQCRKFIVKRLVMKKKKS